MYLLACIYPILMILALSPCTSRTPFISCSSIISVINGQELKNMGAIDECN